MKPQCDHTLYHADQQGRLQGSWAEDLVVDARLGRRVRILCRSCRKFYGYVRDGTSQATQASVIDNLDRTPQMPSETVKSQDVADPAGDVAPESKSPKPKTTLRHGGIDYKRLRQLISMAQVLELIVFVPTAKMGNQLRGPCPVHKSKSTRPRSFSIVVVGGRFQCFKPSCG